MEQNKDQMGAPVKGAFLDNHGKVVLCQDGKEEVCFGFASRLYANQCGAAVRGEAVAESVSDSREFHELAMDYRGASAFTQAPAAYKRLCDFVDALVSARAADAPSEPSVRRHDAYKLASRLQSFADRLCNDQTIGTRYEGDEAELRTAIHFIRSSGRAADALDSQPTDGGVQS